MLLKIGELSKRIGLTVRTLHHYDAIGLVTPSGRSESGYRLYDRNDVARLHRIQALRGLGLSLAEVGAVLAGAGADLRSIIRTQIDAIEQQLQQAAALRERLISLDAQLADDDEPDIDEWLSTLGMMAVRHKYFTVEDLDALHQRTSPREFAMHWSGLVEEVRDAMNRKLPPSCAAARALAERWMILAEQTMGDDPRFFVKLAKMHRSELSVQAVTGVDGAMLDYIDEAGYENRCILYAQYVTPEELANYRSEASKQSMEVWLTLFQDTRIFMESGAGFDHADVRATFSRWHALFQQTWGSDPATRERVRKAHQSESRILLGSGFTPAMQSYIDAGIAALQKPDSDLATAA